MALMSLGLFVFDLPSLAYDRLQRRTAWSHAANPRVGLRPAGQFVGPGEDVVTLTGCVAHGVVGDLASLDDLRQMADSGQAWPLVDGLGRVYGAFCITGLDETQTAVMEGGVPRLCDVSITLQRMDDDAPPPPDAATPAGGAA